MELTNTFKIITLFTGCFIAAIATDSYLKQPKAQTPIIKAVRLEDAKKKMRNSIATPKPVVNIIDENKAFMDSLTSTDRNFKAEAARNPATFGLQVEILKTNRNVAQTVNGATLTQKIILRKLDSLLNQKADTVYIHDTTYVHDSTFIEKVPIIKGAWFKINVTVGKEKQIPSQVKTVIHKSDSTYIKPEDYQAKERL